MSSAYSPNQVYRCTSPDCRVLYYASGPTCPACNTKGSYAYIRFVQ